MKEQNRRITFFKHLPAKLWLLMAVLVAFAFFANDFSLVDIQKTAIILAVGLDRNEKGFHMTAQIAVPKGTDRTTGGTSSVEFKADGETIADCVAEIDCKTGWVPKFVFCNLLLFGEEAAEKNVFDALDYFLRNEYMPDSCYVAVCSGSAEELLTSESAIDDTSSLAITRLFSDSTVKAGKATKMSLKEFAIGYYGPSKSGTMPYIMPHEQQGSGGGNGSQGNAGNTANEPQKSYCAERTALFREGKMVGLLSADQTFALSLIRGKVFAGYLLTEDEGRAVSLTVLKDDGKAEIKVKETPEVKLTLRLTVRLYHRAAPSEIEEITKSDVSDNILENAANTLKTQLNDLWDNVQKSGCDLFQFGRLLYRTSPKTYEKFKDSLTSAPLELDVTLKSAR